MFNLYQVFQSLQTPRTLQAGTVTHMEGDVATIELPGGGTIRARGQALVGDLVFVRDGLIEGKAVALTRIDQEV